MAKYRRSKTNTKFFKDIPKLPKSSKDSGVSFNFDYWMYAILEEACEKKLAQIAKTYNKREYNAFKDNKFDSLGKVKLTLDRVKMVRDNHSFYIERLINSGGNYDD